MTVSFGRAGLRRPIIIGAVFALAISAAPLIVTQERHRAEPVPLAAVQAGSDTPAEARALARAKASGKPVTVDSVTSANTTTVANPDGSFTFTGSATPQRTHKDGSWVPIDASLQPGADGRLATKATDSGLSLSAGGSTPLATFADGHGHQLSVSFPVALPKPTVDGPTALYLDVLPGVDMAMTATVAGGARQVLIIRNAEAAANPVLARLVLKTTTTGLTLRSDAGVIVAADSSTGAEVFTAPAPLMWDSALPDGVTSAAPTDLARNGDRLGSSINGPGVAAKRAPVPAAVTDGAIALTPPRSALLGSNVVYPVYLDPPFTPIAANPYAYVESQHSWVTNFMPTDDLRAGYDDWTSGCGGPCYINGVTRSYLTFQNIGGLGGKVITSSFIQMDQLGSSCPSVASDIAIGITYGHYDFDAGLNWDNQPGWSGIEDVVYLPGGYLPGIQFPLGTVMNFAASNNYQNLHLIMYAGNEGDHCVYRHFGLNPTLVVNYSSTPNAPTGLTTVNGTKSYPCNSTSPGPWIPAAASNQVTLSDSVSTPDAGDGLVAHFYRSANAGASVESTVSVTESGSNTPMPASVVIPVANNTTYAWNANVSNAYRFSPPSPTCYFRYDNAAPSTPTVTSTAYPVNGPTTVTAGGSGTISWSATDAVSGIGSYNYNLNGTSISAGGGGRKTTTATSLSVALSSLSYGTNTIWVQAVDAAGNLSTAVAYNFFVQQKAFGQYQPGVAGDLDGDAIPDLVTVDATGTVRMFSNPEITSNDPTGNTTVDPQQYGGRVIVAATTNARWPMPDTASAAGALLAHAGSFNGNNYDDLIVIQSGHLAVAANPGTPTNWTFPTTDVTKPTCSSCVDYNGADWSSVIQLFALPVSPGARPKLLTVELVNGKATLWLYTALPGYAFQPPVSISAYTSGWHWEDEQIIGAGHLPGTTGTTLWIRDLDGGKLYQLRNLEAGIPDPNTAKIQLATGFTIATYPLLTTFGQADSAGNVAIWSTDSTGALRMIPTSTTSSGTTTVRTTTRQRSATNWASHELALGGNYAQYNNSGVGYENASNHAFDTTTANAYAYAAGAMDNATLDPNTIINDGSGGCPTGWTTCSHAMSPGNTIAVLRANGQYDSFDLPKPWAHRNDNYAAAGQVIPVPTPNTSGPAHTISFLGAASTPDTVNGATVAATITYTNGHTQTVQITFADWTQNVATNPIGNTIQVARCTNRVTAATGAVNATPTYIFATPDLTLLDNGNPLATNVQIASVKLGTNASVHIFSIALA